MLGLFLLLGQEEGVRETPRLLPRVSSSEAPSSIDAKSQKDLEVMKACHDFDSIVSKGSLVAIWKHYSIPGSTHCVLRCSSSMMDLASFYGMLKVSVGKSAPIGQATSSLPEVEEVHMETAPRMSLTLTPKRLAKKSVPQQEDSARVQKQVKIAAGKHKSHRDEGSSRASSKDKGSVVPREEPTPPTYCRLKSMKELCGTMVHKDDKGYYALQMTNLPPRDPNSGMWARWPNLKSSAQVWDDPWAASEFGRGVLHP
ncbi:hypothetical protein BHE74_00051916 [Ensete ventricosum]|nr:hypothetical protein BHE74_00051916 [Ensete ventricosum]